jgi:CubicO group peptidase (beta-lactamase class C family)
MRSSTPGLRGSPRGSLGNAVRRWFLESFLPLLATMVLTFDALGADADFRPARAVIENAVADGAFPGAALVVGTSRQVLWADSIGTLGELPDAPAGQRPAVTPESIYDLASLTKVTGTTAVLLTLVRDGRIGLDDPVARHLPEFLDRARDDDDRAARSSVTVRHLLAHAAGLPAHRALWKDASSPGAIVGGALSTPLETAPGEKESYSDLGFIVLGEVAARAGGKPLAELEVERVFRPLGMRQTRRDLPAAWRPWCAPTERASDGGPTIHGKVHDENARAANGTTGHAGLFSNVTDLSIYAAELLRARRGESKIFPAELTLEFTRRAGIAPGSSRALGWDTATGENSAGTVLSRASFGHTGFTGTSLWIDPERDIFVILLSNRVHPRRDDLRISKVRPAFADAVARAIDEARSASRRGS